MRILLWILLLLALCGVWWKYQARFTAAARAERDRALRTEAPIDAVPGAGHVIVGAKSGVAPIDPPAGWAPTPTDDTRPSEPVVGPANEAEHVVQHGESLSTICAIHYGTSKGDLVQALARYNKIERIGSIREGQKLKIPPRSVLTHDK